MLKIQKKVPGADDSASREEAQDTPIISVESMNRSNETETQGVVKTRKSSKHHKLSKSDSTSSSASSATFNDEAPGSANSSAGSA